MVTVVNVLSILPLLMLQKDALYGYIDTLLECAVLCTSHSFGMFAIPLYRNCLLILRCEMPIASRGRTSRDTVITSIYATLEQCFSTGCIVHPSVYHCVGVYIVNTCIMMYELACLQLI